MSSKESAAPSRKWTRLNADTMASGDWMVTRNKVQGVFRYSAWRGSEKNAAGYRDSFADACKLIDELEGWATDYERNESASA